jgi:NAD(P)-dependent dehydrogenase (short-subunit alcohol dehydrogenase family)
VAPTFTKTSGTKKWLENEECYQSVIKRIPLGRVGNPEKVAATVVFQASPQALFITGATLMIDGGWTIQ